eukprot:2182339-Amphidinium_carterae.1
MAVCACSDVRPILLSDNTVVGRCNIEEDACSGPLARCRRARQAVAYKSAPPLKSHSLRHQERLMPFRACSISTEFSSCLPHYYAQVE